jgi:hypothetical protein
MVIGVNSVIGRKYLISVISNAVDSLLTKRLINKL